jgi:pSer/pThr/pTyr-binding forkhead associated (FHA) protein
MDADRTTMMGATGGFASAALVEQCPSCSTQIPPGDEFCPKCGYQRGTWAAAAQPAASMGAATPSPAAPSGPALWTLELPSGSQPLGAGTYIIGRGEVDVRIDDGYASRRHAQLEVRADGVTLSDLGSSNGTFSGGRQLTANQPEQLLDGAEFKVANTTLTLRRAAGDATVIAASPDATVVAPPSETAEAAGTSGMDANRQEDLGTDAEGTAIDPSSQLEPEKEGHTPKVDSVSHWELQRDGGETIKIELGQLTVGRKADAADRVIEGDSYVSGCHARLIATEHTLEITDLRSTNGTFVNEARLEPEQPWQLTTGDTLRIGQTSFTVVNNKPALTPGMEETQEEEEEES